MKIPVEVHPSHYAISSHNITSAVTTPSLISSPAPVVMSDIFHSGVIVTCTCCFEWYFSFRDLKFFHNWMKLNLQWMYS